MMARVSLLSPSTLERHAYCLCLHVRPATIFVACMNLAGSMLCALLTFFFMINKDHKNNNDFFSRFARDEMNRINMISVLMYLVLALVSAMLLYGVMKSKPRYILPFFGIQFIDYLFTLPQFVASISHPYHYHVYKSKNMIEILDQNNKSADFDDMRNVWSNSSSSQVYTTSLLILTLIMIFKTYFLCVVWKCYRYLHMTELILPIALQAGAFEPEMLPPMVINRANVPPPNYEEATKMPEYKPPEYTAVVTGINQNDNFQNTVTNSQQQQPATSETSSETQQSQQQQQQTPDTQIMKNV